MFYIISIYFDQSKPDFYTNCQSCNCGQLSYNYMQHDPNFKL